MNLSWRQPMTLAHDLHPLIKSWLLYRDSMTARMLGHCSKLKIKVLHHHFQRPTLLESRILHLMPEAMASIREVVMICDNQPWLYARAVIPMSVLHGPARRLHYLGSVPLGRMLFQELHLKRGTFEIARLQDPRFSIDKSLWARRSQFTGLSAPILLCEAFLPAMEQAILKGTSA